MASLKLAQDMDLGHILTHWNIEDAMSGSDVSGHSSDRGTMPGAPTRCRRMKRKVRKSAERMAGA